MGEYIIPHGDRGICNSYPRRLFLPHGRSAFSLTGSQTPSVWLNVDGVYLIAACTVPGYSGAIGVIYAEVDQLPFNQDSTWKC